MFSVTDEPLVGRDPPFKVLKGTQVQPAASRPPPLGSHVAGLGTGRHSPTLSCTEECAFAQSKTTVFNGFIFFKENL